MSLTFSQVQHAWQVQDPTLVDKLCSLAAQPDPIAQAPIPEDELTFERFLNTIFSHEFREQPEEVQFAKRVAMIAKLEADSGVYPLPGRYKIHIILNALWEDGSAYSRATLIEAIDKLPLSYGVWKGLKRIYKAAEYAQDYEMFGHIAAKIDLYRFDKSARTPVSIATKTYMSLRAWRYLRTLGQQMPVCYIEAAVSLLACIDEKMTLNDSRRVRSWALNHICFHHSLKYGVSRFSHSTKRKLFDAKGRAFSEAWQRDPEPLFRLVAIAKNEDIRQFATDSLKHDFKTELRDVHVATLQYLSSGLSHSRARDELIVWLIEQSPKFEKAKFRELGLHEVVLKLLHSPCSDAYQYAISYAKGYASDLTASTLMILALSSHEAVRKFAMEQVLARDPVKDIGLEGWGQLLDTDYHHAIANKQLTKHFGRRELTPDWFFERLVSGSLFSVDFASQRLPELYSAKELESNYYIGVAQQLDVVAHSYYHDYDDDLYSDYDSDGSSSNDIDDGYPPTTAHNIHSKAAANECSMTFALGELKRLDLAQIAPEVWQYLLLHPLAQATIIEWINQDLIAPAKLSMTYWHALAYEPDWQSSEYIYRLKTESIGLINTSSAAPITTAITSASDQLSNSIKSWQQQLSFSEDLADIVRSWLADVRRFAPTELGFDWLMTLAQSSQANYREFAIDRINKGFLPADFVAFYDASADTQPTDSDNDVSLADSALAVASTKASDNESSTQIDLGAQSFLFTGKMQSMTRGEAEAQVKAANGSISGTVNAKLDYLVIGDEGSPLYGNGRKGSKQLKAESLIEQGAPLKIISETAFLQMLTGQVREVSEDDTLAGAKALWHMAIDDPAAPISELAISYLTHHHEQICLALTDRPVDPDAIIPNEFFSAARIMPLLQHPQARLRSFALLISEYELASWQPTAELWLNMAQSPHHDVRQLFKRALLDKPTTANRRYHISSEQISATMLYALIGSRERFARQIGITLLQRFPKFQQVDTLYRLTQSSDREVRYAAITMLWQRFKAQHISINWQASSERNLSLSSSSGTPVNQVTTNPAKATSKNANTTPADKPSTSSKSDASEHFKQPPKAMLQDLPADFEQLLMLLRRGLFETPPGRLPSLKSDSDKSHGNSSPSSQSSRTRHWDKSSDHPEDSALAPIKPISASQAKLALIETFRDVAMADQDLAALIMPVLYTFTHSAGKMERHACLVAVTRLLNRYPKLATRLEASQEIVET